MIHSFFVPSLGVQRYAIPGRTIETWFRADKPGVYYGECNQICGTNHSRMPIAVHAVTDQEFDAWVTQAKTKFADTAPARPEQPRVRRGGPALTKLAGACSRRAYSRGTGRSYDDVGHDPRPRA